MPRQTVPKRIRRCITCNVKTHQRLWEGPECPLCDSSEGFVESSHGGLSERELRELLEKPDIGKERE